MSKKLNNNKKKMSNIIKTKMKLCSVLLIDLLISLVLDL